MKDCELCTNDGGSLLWRDALCRIVRVSEAQFSDYPGFCRVVLNRHVRELTDLAASEREQMMRAVFACEGALRELFRPDKINIASLGNIVPHVHWHVIARHRDDRHFPDPVWCAPHRAPRARAESISNARFAAALAAGLK